MCTTLLVIQSAGIRSSAFASTDTSEPGLYEADVMPAIVQRDAALALSTPPALLVDPVNNVAFTHGKVPGSDSFAMYDLERMRGQLVGDEALDESGNVNVESLLASAVDPERQRVIVSRTGIVGPPNLGSQQCPQAVGSDMLVWDYGTFDEDGNRILTDSKQKFPCSGRFYFSPKAGFFHRPSGKLYMAGTTHLESWRTVAGVLGVENNDGQPLLVRQIDLAKLETDPPNALDWEIDLQYAGCGRWKQPFIARVGDSVLSYCNEVSAGAVRPGVGHTGYVVRIPLNEDHTLQFPPDQEPVADPLRKGWVNAVVRRLPALPGDATLFFEPTTGSVLVVTSNRINGNAVWVYDPVAERFVGAITGGFADNPQGKTAVGFDPTRGRVYSLTSEGVLVADAGARPLPGGEIFPVVDDEDEVVGGNTRVISVAPRLRRVFVPVDGAGYVVLNDTIPTPAVAVEPDPDDLTAQIDEQEGLTRANATGAGSAAGAHLVVAGGLARSVRSVDPACFSAFEQQLLGGKCAIDLILASGNRDLTLAASDVEAGTDTGTLARGAGLAFSPDDHASDHDLKNAGACFRGTAQATAGHVATLFQAPPPPNELFDGYEAGCDALLTGATGNERDKDGNLVPADADDPRSRVPDPRGGTRGPDRRGFPVRASDCTDFGARPNADQQGGSDGLPQSAAFSSAVSCDANRVVATSRASSAGLALPDLADPVVTVAATGTEASSLKGADGHVTQVRAWASGVVIGPLQIGRVETEATTRAKGRTGSAAAEFHRRWCDVTIDGEPVAQGCFDPEDEDDPNAVETRERVDRLNQATARFWISVPEVSIEFTDGGYQAVVTKDADTRAADRSVNEDDSHTGAGIQVVVYNDGVEGRNRYILQLAGAHAESRYQIIRLVKFEVPEFPPPVRTFTPPTVIGRPAIPGTPGHPATVEEIEILGASVTRPLAAHDEREFFQTTGNPLRDFFGWVWNHPLEAALLFVLWAILAVPVYFFIRRRAFARSLMLARSGAGFR